MANSSDRVGYENFRSLLWKAQASVFYHHHLADKFRWQARASTVANLLLSAGAMVGLAGFVQEFLPFFSLIIGVLLAAINAYVLGFDLVNRAFSHSRLGEDWIEQTAQVEASWAIGDDTQRIAALNDCRRRQSDLDKREPPTKARLSHWAGLKSARALGMEPPERAGLFLKLTTFWW